MKLGRRVQVDEYLLTRIASDFGTAILVEKKSGGAEHTYHVNLVADGGTCECLGFTRWARCRHGDALQALTAAGQL
jgi:hypothetical protein